MNASSEPSLMDPFEQGTRERIATLEDTVSRHCPSRFSASRLHRESGMLSRRQTISTLRSVPNIVRKDAWQLKQGTQSSSERSCAEEDPFKIDGTVGPTPGRRGSRHCAHMCTACHFLPKNDFDWFLSRDKSHRGTASSVVAKARPKKSLV